MNDSRKSPLFPRRAVALIVAAVALLAWNRLPIPRLVPTRYYLLVLLVANVTFLILVVNLLVKRVARWCLGAGESDLRGRARESLPVWLLGAYIAAQFLAPNRFYVGLHWILGLVATAGG